MQEYVIQFIRGCIIYYTNEPNMIEQGLCFPLLLHTRLGLSIYRDCVDGFPNTEWEHDYLSMVLDNFRDVCHDAL
jgi:hypothetical protein